MLIPARVIKLNESYSSLGKTPGQEAIRSECSRRANFFSVSVENVIRFARQISHLWHGELHPKRHLILRDPSVDFSIRRARNLQLMKFIQTIEHVSTTGGIDSRRIAEVKHGILP